MMPLHHPVDTAHRIAMLDHMARGRFYWGIGLRSLPTDLQLYGVEYDSMDDVRERGREALEIVLGLWENADSGKFGYEGKHFQIHAPEEMAELGRRLYFKPYQQPHPPIGVAASSPNTETIRMAGERGWIPMTNLPNKYVPDLWHSCEQGAASTGRVADRSELRLGRDIYVGETPESAREEARIVLGKPFEEHQWKNRKAGGILNQLKSDPNMADEDVTVDYMMEKHLDRRRPVGGGGKDRADLRGDRRFRLPAGHHPGPRRPHPRPALSAASDGTGGPQGLPPQLTRLAVPSPLRETVRVRVASSPQKLS